MKPTGTGMRMTMGDHVAFWVARHLPARVQAAVLILDDMRDDVFARDARAAADPELVDALAKQVSDAMKREDSR